MKVFLSLLFCSAVALALPGARRLRPEEYWRPAQGRDLSKYQPRHALVKAGGMSMDEQMVMLSKAAHSLTNGATTKKGSTVDLAGECGIEGPPMADRIVGGHEAQENQWPWQVALFIDDAWFCGGALISENYVLTAAHCADGASYFDIMAGAHNVRASSEPHRVEITSYNGWTHPEWNTADLSNDLALIELPSPIDFNDYIKPSCIPSKGDTADVSELVTCTGWGKPSDSAGGISPVLRMVEDRPIISNAECNAVYGIVGSKVVCIDTTGGKGTCNGDSGGPLNMKAEVTKAGQQWKQVGIVSFGASAGCEVGYPAGFTRVESYLEWIMSETGMQL
jgi:secreted trypsin-like serine protease